MNIVAGFRSIWLAAFVFAVGCLAPSAGLATEPLPDDQVPIPRESQPEVMALMRSEEAFNFSANRRVYSFSGREVSAVFACWNEVATREIVSNIEIRDYVISFVELDDSTLIKFGPVAEWNFDEPPFVDENGIEFDFPRFQHSNDVFCLVDQETGSVEYLRSTETGYRWYRQELQGPEADD